MQGVYIGETKVSFDGFENEQNNNRKCRLSTRRKFANILVDCEYFEYNNTDNQKYFSFLVTIKQYGKRRQPNHWFELCANTKNAKYNYMNFRSNNKETDIREDALQKRAFSNIITEISDNNNDDFTVKFIKYTIKSVKGDVTTEKTPDFIVRLRQEFTNAINAKKGLNAN